jgi:hypothetical protein
MARHIVERLTESPVMAPMYSQRSRRLTKGRSPRSSCKSLMAPSSSFAADPGLFFGTKDSPLWAFWMYRLTEERLTEKVRAA